MRIRYRQTFRFYWSLSKNAADEISGPNGTVTRSLFNAVTCLQRQVQDCIIGLQGIEVLLLSKCNNDLNEGFLFLHKKTAVHKAAKKNYALHAGNKGMIADNSVLQLLMIQLCQKQHARVGQN